MMPIRILVADDHPLIREGIRYELSHSPSQFKIVAEAATGDEVFVLIQDVKPDVLILDVRMPGKPAVEILRVLKQFPFPCQVLILSIFGDKSTVLEMLNAGAAGYLLKEEAPGLLTEALTSLSQGVHWISPGVSKIIQQSSQPAPAPTQALTPREEEVLSFLVAGQSNRQIAAALHICQSTVEFHVKNILKKWGAENRLQAVACAAKRARG